MELNQLSVPFINAMVEGMYRYEASLINTEVLLIDEEMYDFYMSYCYYKR